MLAPIFLFFLKSVAADTFFAASSKLSGFIYVLYNNQLLNYIDIQQLYIIQ